MLLRGLLPRSKLPLFERSTPPRGAFPVPAQGGRSLRFILVPPPRSIVPFCCGRLLPPNPEGARPRSVELPCASQLRVFEPGLGRCELLLNPPRFEFISGARRMLEPEFGLSSESSRWRVDIPPL